MVAVQTDIRGRIVVNARSTIRNFGCLHSSTSTIHTKNTIQLVQHLSAFFRHGCRESCGDLRQQVGLNTTLDESLVIGHAYGALSCVSHHWTALTQRTTYQTPIVSLAATQSTLLSHQVYLTDRIDNKKRDRMPHMKCVCFLQNSEDSLGSLEEELKEPKYGEYYLCQSVNLSGLRCVILNTYEGRQTSATY